MISKIAGDFFKITVLFYNILFLIFSVSCISISLLQDGIDYMGTFQVYLGDFAPKISFYIEMILLLAATICIIAEKEFRVGWLIEILAFLPLLYAFYMDAYVYLLPENQLGVFIIPSPLMIWITAVALVFAIGGFILSLKTKNKNLSNIH